MTRREFGSTLRRERERRQVTLKSIAERTKIGASLLDDLERGDCSRWPAGIYSRAWIRDYAEAVGLDVDRTAAEFAQCFTETAFPGEPEKKPAVTTPPSPLRLTFDEAPRHRMRQATRRGFLMTVDTVAAVLVASLLSFTGLLTFWTSVAACVLVLHAVGTLSGDGSATGYALRLLGDGRAHETEPSSESAFAEAA